MLQYIEHDGYPSDPKKQKPYHELDCPVLPQIQQEVLAWVKQNTDFFSTRSEAFWHKITGGAMARECPTLMRYMKSIKTPLREIAVGVLTETMKDDGLLLHVGSTLHQAKINFPIHNVEDVYTEWYDVPRSKMAELGVRRDWNSDSMIYQLHKIHKTVADDYECVARYNMLEKPIVFNSWIAHRVIPGKSAKYPRIMLATMPFKDPRHLLDRDQPLL